MAESDSNSADSTRSRHNPSFYIPSSVVDTCGRVVDVLTWYKSALEYTFSKSVHVTPLFNSTPGIPTRFYTNITMSTAENPVPVDSKFASRTATHPFRVYGYKVTHEWVWKFGKDHGLERPGMSKDSLESAVFGRLLFRLPGLERHFIDDPSDTDYGYSHCLSIANNWNPKKIPLVASRLQRWKSVLGTEEQPRWYVPTRLTVPGR